MRIIRKSHQAYTNASHEQRTQYTYYEQIDVACVESASIRQNRYRQLRVAPCYQIVEKSNSSMLLIREHQLQNGKRFYIYRYIYVHNTIYSQITHIHTHTPRLQLQIGNETKTNQIITQDYYGNQMANCMGLQCCAYTLYTESSEQHKKQEQIARYNAKEKQPHNLGNEISKIRVMLK